MVGDQIVNKAINPIKKGEKNSPVLEELNCSTTCFDATLLAYRPVCVCLSGRFGALLWWVASGWGPTGLQVEAFGGKLAGLWGVGLE
jgi:hypothetical protein